MSTETVEAQRSLFEAKSRAELIDIASAMGGRPSQRSRKAELVDMIVELAGFGPDATGADAAAEVAAPSADAAEAAAPAPAEAAGAAGAAEAADGDGAEAAAQQGPSNGSEPGDEPQASESRRQPARRAEA
ncbi:MAG: hypothetical protein OXG52_11295, partial [bacterium]|nr:hypothetical protein [bacterium]